MLRSILTDKWFIGACVVLIVFVIGGIFWSHHELAPYKKAADESAEKRRQLEAAQKEADTPKMVESVNDEVVDDNNIAENIEGNRSQTADMLNNKDVAVSPFGFGPYPEVPSDFPDIVSWDDPEGQANLPDHANKNIELIERVLIKLWNQGDKSHHGSGSTHNGKVYPHYDNTVYVRYVEYELPDGTMHRYPGLVKSGPQVIYSRDDLLNPPIHLSIIDLDSSGIDPYQFLELP